MRLDKSSWVEAKQRTSTGIRIGLPLSQLLVELISFLTHPYALFPYTNPR